VADLVVGFTVLRGEGPAEVRERYAEERLAERGLRFDYVAWDLYAEVTRFYREDESRLSHRRETLRHMEEREGPIADLAGWVSDRMVRYHLMTMDRIDVRYDLLPRESDILAAGFWHAAFERLRKTEAIQLATEGRLAGCWIMRMHGAEAGAGEDEKVIVRSDGTVTYVGKDIAYQLWKHGLLGRDFGYRRWDWSSCPEIYPVWTTAPTGAGDDHPPFGGAHVVYNVIDTRQAFLQRVVSQGLCALGHPGEAERSIHYSYEMVALSPAAVAAMFPDHELTEEERSKPHVEMSGRRGLGVRADDLLDALLGRARDEVARRNPDMDPLALDATARKIAVGALRYYMLRFTRNRVVAFDLDAALAFEGETGPYLQYSVVRARNILGKAREAFGDDAVDARGLARRARLDALPADARAEHWSLPLALGRTGAALAAAIESLELSSVAKHAYVLAQSFNSFYHRHPVVQEPDAAARDARLAVVRLYHDGMVELLGTMGIEVPDRM
jgi:arginyl-tRNA synthetase